MTRQDIEALKEMDRWLSTQYNRTSGLERDKRFGLATWVLGWGLYKTYSTIRHIKDNIRTLSYLFRRTLFGYYLWSCIIQ